MVAHQALTIELNPWNSHDESCLLTSICVYTHIIQVTKVQVAMVGHVYNLILCWRLKQEEGSHELKASMSYSEPLFQKEKKKISKK